MRNVYCTNSCHTISHYAHAHAHALARARTRTRTRARTHKYMHNTRARTHSDERRKKTQHNDIIHNYQPRVTVQYYVH